MRRPQAHPRDMQGVRRGWDGLPSTPPAACFLPAGAHVSQADFIWPLLMGREPRDVLEMRDHKRIRCIRVPDGCGRLWVIALGDAERVRVRAHVRLGAAAQIESVANGVAWWRQAA
eukprot:CAMPEP_0174722182 /NCGR_PEP_ID=MMETSP1094-20130205/37779_1 /TAXON_ID=156173 /ORGANISM="Chrysochromulina brevifilum, Strain UTEX LB 985" /LENGTH=115 /DNA_ID=CAMNT_0015922983 /DNA_START=337 /DNA_END=684 /DNA_ORIENTATION=+